MPLDSCFTGRRPETFIQRGLRFSPPCCRAGVASVAVTSHPRRELVEQVLEAFAPDVWQSDAEDFDSIELPPGMERWPVYRREAPVDSLPGRLLFDSPMSGTGMRADWQCAARLALRSELVLAGGLDATNVGRAIASVQPFGVDVSSGVERSPGVKDAALIRGFILAARRASRKSVHERRRRGRRDSQVPGRGARRVLSRQARSLGPFGGRYVPETLVPALDRLEEGVAQFLHAEEFQRELARELVDWAGRPTALTFASTLSRNWARKSG